MSENENVILQLPRGTDGKNELRIIFSEFKGHPFLNVREWFLSDDGNWYPTKKGVSIKMRELDPVISALQSMQSEGNRKRQVDEELPPDESMPF